MVRPAAIVVFGILNVVFGSLGFLSVVVAVGVWAFATAQHNPIPMIQFGPGAFGLLVLQLASCVALIASGIGLLKDRMWGRTVALGCGFYSIASGLFGFVYNLFFLWIPLLNQLETQGETYGPMLPGLIGGAVGSVLGLIYPTCLIYFLSRPAVRGYLRWKSRQWPVENLSSANGEPVVVDNNPYASPQFASDDIPYGEIVTEPTNVHDGTHDTVSTLIPYKNSAALIAYYLGVFSISALIPLLGIIGIGMAVAAVVYGVKGLMRVRRQPEVKGSVHAWIGIVTGTLFGVMGAVIQLAILVLVGMRSD